MLRVGENRFTAAISDARGTIPPKQDAAAYFAITGTPTGGRNDLSLENEFVIVIVIDSMESPGVPPELETPSKIVELESGSLDAKRSVGKTHQRKSA